MSNPLYAHKESPTPLKPLTRPTHNDEDKSYRYKEEPVEVVVVFDEGNKRIAIVENSRGEQFDVPMSDLERV